MQNFLNSPAGPLGGAGQSGTSTTPQNIFNNANGIGSRFGAGIDAFKNRVGAFSPERLFGENGPLSHLFGGDGSMIGGLKGAFGQQGVGGIPQNLASIFGPRGLGGVPQNVGNIFNNQPQQGPQPNAPTGMPNQAAASNRNGFGGGGFLSRFMGGNQNG
jgi:hypothetical protein